MSSCGLMDKAPPS